MTTKSFVFVLIYFIEDFNYNKLLPIFLKLIKSFDQTINKPTYKLTFSVIYRNVINFL